MSSVSTAEKARRLRYFGWFITPVFAIGHGIITTVSVSGLAFLAPLGLPWLAPILIAIFIAETLVSIYLFKEAVPETLINIFLYDIFDNLSKPKKVLLVVGLISAAGAGIALAALIYVSAIKAFTSIAIFVGVSTSAVGLMIPAGFLAVVAFFALSTLLIKWIRIAIRDDLHLQAVQFFKDIFTRNEEKLLAQQILEGIFKLLFVFSIIALTFVGTIAILGTMRKGLFSFLTLIPNANILACKISSGIIVYGLMAVSRFPWALRSVCVVFAAIGEFIGYAIFRTGLFIVTTFDLYLLPEKNVCIEASVKEEKTESTLLDIVWLVLTCTLKILATLVHSLSSGALAQSGGGAVISDALTQLDLPLSPSVIEDLGQTSSIVAGAIMSGGIAASGFFAQSFPEKAVRSEKAKVVEEMPLLERNFEKVAMAQQTPVAVNNQN
jgi:hypothetical protein